MHNGFEALRVAGLPVAIACVLGLVGCGSTPTGADVEVATPTDITIRVASEQGDDPLAAGKAAATALVGSMGGAKLQAVIVAECFEDEAAKRQALEGVCSVVPAAVVYGGSTYGSFAQSGCVDIDGISLLGIGGDGITVETAVVRDMGVGKLSMEEAADEIESRLHTSGAELARALQRSESDRLLIVIPDAHSPKNAFVVAGVQEVVGKDFPITGGSANKSEGQTAVYYRGELLRDSAVALLLSGDFEVALAGRKAKDNDAVIATAKDGAVEALSKLGDAKPFAAIAFDCGGRKGKLDNLEDELAAMQAAFGKELPLFGCYCAGEIGPADQSEATPGTLSSGVGWHVMYAVLGSR